MTKASSDVRAVLVKGIRKPKADTFKQFEIIICPQKFAIKGNILFAYLNSNRILPITVKPNKCLLFY